MKKKLPKALGREPLVDALFEVRFSGPHTLSDVLPGYLLAKLGSKAEITRLPAAEIPHPMRMNDPALKFAPTQRLEWKEYFISIGDQNVIISCKMPYQKWPDFKKTILEIMDHIRELNISGLVDRYSVKYVNLIQASTLAEQIEKITLAIKLGDVEMKTDRMTLQIQQEEGEMLHILSVMTGAEVQMLDEKRLSGTILEIDSIQSDIQIKFDDFADNLEVNVEKLRQSNKIKFFSCLTDDAIKEMEPEYE